MNLQIAAVRAELGLDRPLSEQYKNRLGNAVCGDFGNSRSTGQPMSRSFPQAFLQ